jgi:glycosyltransferase involved in cell wall biosynthesis
MGTSVERRASVTNQAFIPVTVLILSKNEEFTIGDCIKSASDFEQIIVVDSNSVDKTVQISKKLGAEVVNFSWNNLYPKKKQWALELEQIKYDWVLFLDSDERVTPELSNDIFNFIMKAESDNTYAIEIPLRYYFSGKSLRWGLQMYKRSLINRNFCRFPEIDDLSVTNMWEVEGHYQPILSEGCTDRFTSFIDHKDPDSFFHFFARHNKYSDWEAFLLCNKGVKQQVETARTSQGKFFSRSPLKPLLIFIYSYVLKLGFLDGRAGFDFAISRSFYYWQIGLKAREMSSSGDKAKIFESHVDK